MQNQQQLNAKVKIFLQYAIEEPILIHEASDLRLNMESGQINPLELLNELSKINFLSYHKLTIQIDQFFLIKNIYENIWEFLGQPQQWQSLKNNFESNREPIDIANYLDQTHSIQVKFRIQ